MLRTEGTAARSWRCSWSERTSRTRVRLRSGTRKLAFSVDLDNEKLRAQAAAYKSRVPRLRSINEERESGEEVDRRIRGKVSRVQDTGHVRLPARAEAIRDRHLHAYSGPEVELRRAAADAR